MAFSNEAELRAALEAACINAVAEAENKVYSTIKPNVVEYYNEFSPDEYIRTDALLHSLQKTDIKSNGIGAWAEVYFEPPSYQNGIMPLQHTPEHGWYGYATWGGEKVLDVAMQGSHGGYTSGIPIWSRSMKSLGGQSGIEHLMVRALKKQGLIIK